MADRTDVKLTAITPEGTKSTTNINYANPEAQNSTLLQLATKMNALTRNTYSKSDKVDTTNLDTAEDSHRQTATLTLPETSKSISALDSALDNNNQYKFTYVYTGDAEPQVSVYANGIAVNSWNDGGTNYRLAITKTGTIPACTINIICPATDNYHEISATYTITA